MLLQVPGTCLLAMKMAKVASLCGLHIVGNSKSAGHCGCDAVMHSGEEAKNVVGPNSCSMGGSATMNVHPRRAMNLVTAEAKMITKNTLH